MFYRTRLSPNSGALRNSYGVIPGPFWSQVRLRVLLIFRAQKRLPYGAGDACLDIHFILGDGPATMQVNDTAGLVTGRLY